MQTKTRKITIFLMGFVLGYLTFPIHSQAREVVRSQSCQANLSSLQPKTLQSELIQEQLLAERYEGIGNKLRSILTLGLIDKRVAAEATVYLHAGADSHIEEAVGVHATVTSLLPGENTDSAVFNLLAGVAGSSPIEILGKRDFASLAQEFHMNGREILEERLKSGILILFKSSAGMDEIIKDSSGMTVSNVAYIFPSLAPELIEAVFIPQDIASMVIPYLSTEQRAKLVLVEGMIRPVNSRDYPALETAEFGLQIPDWYSAIRRYVKAHALSGTLLLHGSRLETLSEITARYSVDPVRLRMKELFSGNIPIVDYWRELQEYQHFRKALTKKDQHAVLPAMFATAGVDQINKQNQHRFEQARRALHEKRLAFILNFISNGKFESQTQALEALGWILDQTKGELKGYPSFRKHEKVILRTILFGTLKFLEEAGNETHAIEMEQLIFKTLEEVTILQDEGVFRFQFGRHDNSGNHFKTAEREIRQADMVVLEVNDPVMITIHSQAGEVTLSIFDALSKGLISPGEAEDHLKRLGLRPTFREQIMNDFHLIYKTGKQILIADPPTQQISMVNALIREAEQEYLRAYEKIFLGIANLNDIQHLVSLYAVYLQLEAHVLFLRDQQLAGILQQARSDWFQEHLFYPHILIVRGAAHSTLAKFLKKQWPKNVESFYLENVIRQGLPMQASYSRKLNVQKFGLGPSLEIKQEKVISIFASFLIVSAIAPEMQNGSIINQRLVNKIAMRIKSAAAIEKFVLLRSQLLQDKQDSFSVAVKEWLVENSFASEAELETLISRRKDSQVAIYLAA